MDAGYVVTATGRRCHLGRRPSPSQCFNYPVQGSAADVMYAALAELWGATSGLEWFRPLVVVHDEIVVEVPEDRVEDAKRILETAMVAGYLDVFPEETTRDLVEAKSGRTWKEAK